MYIFFPLINSLKKLLLYNRSSTVHIGFQADYPTRRGRRWKRNAGSGKTGVGRQHRGQQPCQSRSRHHRILSGENPAFFNKCFFRI
jgi:hypothetical protein